MAIYDIENKTLRRTAIVVCYPILYLLILFFDLAGFIYEVIERLVPECWNIIKNNTNFIIASAKNAWNKE